MNTPKTIKIIKELSKELCPKCKKYMERRRHAMLTEKILSGGFFSEWDYCPECSHVQHYDKFKINPRE